MADIKCPKCLEPWDIDELHEVVGERVGPHDRVVDSFESAYSIFKRSGCGTLFSNRPCERPDSPEGRREADTLAELADLMGDDVDGYFSLGEDVESLFG